MYDNNTYGNTATITYDLNYSELLVATGGAETIITYDNGGQSTISAADLTAATASRSRTVEVSYTVDATTRGDTDTDDLAIATSGGFSTGTLEDRAGNPMTEPYLGTFTNETLS